MANQHTGQQSRAEVTAWVAWHAAELAALGIPSVLAMTVSVWFWAVAALSGAGWATHEIRQQHRRRALQPAKTTQQVTDAHDTTVTESAGSGSASEGV